MILSTPSEGKEKKCPQWKIGRKEREKVAVIDGRQKHLRCLKALVLRSSEDRCRGIESHAPMHKLWSAGGKERTAALTSRMKEGRSKKGLFFVFLGSCWDESSCLYAVLMIAFQSRPSVWFHKELARKIHIGSYMVYAVTGQLRRGQLRRGQLRRGQLRQGQLDSPNWGEDNWGGGQLDSLTEPKTEHFWNKLTSFFQTEANNLIPFLIQISW